MSAWKSLALGITICGLTASAAHADPISWPTGLSDWMIYLAAPSGGGNASAPAVSYHVVSNQYTPAQSVPVVPSQPAPVQLSPPGPVNVAANTPWVVVPPTPMTVTPPMTVTAPMMVTPPMTIAPPSSAISVPAPAPPVSTAPVDGYINLGTGPYPMASLITTGGAQPWYQSSQITSLFGGQPTAQQIQSFDNTILQRVQQTFSQSGISVSLTTNPNVPALHTISLVSNTASASLASAIGMTQVGHNGFSFLDKIVPSTQSLDQLEWIVAHNISHEMMLAFGVPENYDQTGQYVDSKMANWSMMVSSASTFSPAAAQAISAALASQGGGAAYQLGAQEVSPLPAPIPEPTTIALWVMGAAGMVIARQRRRRPDCDSKQRSL